MNFPIAVHNYEYMTIFYIAAPADPTTRSLFQFVLGCCLLVLLPEAENLGKQLSDKFLYSLIHSTVFSCFTFKKKQNHVLLLI